MTVYHTMMMQIVMTVAVKTKLQCMYHLFKQILAYNSDLTSQQDRICSACPLCKRKVKDCGRWQVRKCRYVTDRERVLKGK
mmetsp:Transcript_13504/g.15728  ORF Transcript_13504/g.15728 Transcript_13504/m.15728 type:complete len:81 (+) Transcript_13504:591-833(+)